MQFNIDKNLAHIVINELYKKSESLDISINLSEENIFVFGDALEKEDFNEIGIFVKTDISLYKSHQHYQDYEIKPDEDFYKGEQLALESLTKALQEDPIYYKDKLIDLKISLESPQNLSLDGELILIYDFIQKRKEDLIQENKKALSQSNGLNLLNSQEAKDKFNELAKLQRDLPERKMLECQRLMGGGVISSLLEHIGDLTHRMSEKVFSGSGNIEDSIEFVLPKIEKGIREIRRPYGIDKEHLENMENNYTYFQSDKPFNKTFEEWMNIVNQKLQEYSQEHSKLPVYNEAQYAAREAAVAIGKLDFKSADKHLDYLHTIIENGTYVDIASRYDKDFDKNKKPHLLKRGL